MGECGPTATHYALYPGPLRYSRWGNAGQLQLGRTRRVSGEVIADGGMRANCNYGDNTGFGDML